MNIATLTKENFWNEIEKMFPMAFKKFSDYIDDFKASCNWDNLFSIGIIRNEFPGDFDIKFHDIPYAMQKGVIENFFLLENIQYNILRHPFNPANWTFQTIDVTSKAIWTQFTDTTHRELAQYTTPEQAEVASIQMAFQILNNSYIKNLN